MRYFLDVNILVAWGWSDHVDHERTVRWILDQKVLYKKSRSLRLLTSAIPQIGLVRVSVQRSAGQVTVVDAGKVLSGMLTSLGSLHQFLPDDVDGSCWPHWCRTAAHSTDAHLLQLASKHQATFATLDGFIPGAFVLPCF
jgi:uncharacterized protein